MESQLSVITQNRKETLGVASREPIQLLRVLSHKSNLPSPHAFRIWYHPHLRLLSSISIDSKNGPSSGVFQT